MKTVFRNIAKGAILFRAMPEDMAEAILSQSHVQYVNSGDAVFYRGEDALNIFVVLDGWITLSRTTPNGMETVVGVFTRNQSFGEAVAFKGGVYPVDAVATTDTVLLKIPIVELQRVIMSDPSVFSAILSATFAHLHDLVSQLEQLKSHNATQRVAGFLLSLCDPDAPTNPAIVKLPFDKSLVAAKLGIKPESLSRIFASLKERGVVINGAYAVINDCESLKSFADVDE